MTAAYIEYVTMLLIKPASSAASSTGSTAGGPTTVISNKATYSVLECVALAAV